MKKYVQYGCGHSAPAEWINFDISPTLRIQKTPVLGSLLKKKLNTQFAPNVQFGDIVRGLPVADNSCDGVFCCHVLDNLSLEDFRIALKNTYKILKEGGIFRCVLPDLEFETRKYLASLESGNKSASIQFLNDTLLGFVNRPKDFKGFLYSFFSNARHLWMWDHESMQEELKLSGFRDIRRCVFHDSGDEMFKLPENDEGRFSNAICFECRK